MPLNPITSTILVTGLTPNKGYDQALSFIVTHLPSVSANIVGVPNNLSTIQSSLYGKSQSNILFHPKLSQSQLLSIYYNVDFALCLSIDEGFGIPFLDALLFDLPIIARDIPIYREVFTHTSCYLKYQSYSPLWITDDTPSDYICSFISKLVRRSPTYKAQAYIDNHKNIRELYRQQADPILKIINLGAHTPISL